MTPALCFLVPLSLGGKGHSYSPSHKDKKFLGGHKENIRKDGNICKKSTTI